MKLNKRHIGMKFTFKNTFFNEVFEGTVISLSRYNTWIETKSGIGVFSRSEIIIIAEIKPQMTFTVIDSWTNPNRQWTWTKLADLDIKGRKMMDATLTAAFAQMIINNPSIKDHTITV